MTCVADKHGGESFCSSLIATRISNSLRLGCTVHVYLPSTKLFSWTYSEERDIVWQTHDDDDHSSGDFQNQSFDDHEDKDVIRALGIENVRRLASMTDGELADFEDSSSVDSEIAEDGRSHSSSELSSEDMPQVTYCTNCTADLDPGQDICTVNVFLIAKLQLSLTEDQNLL